jgi:hypothetical protein
MGSKTEAPVWTMPPAGSPPGARIGFATARRSCQRRRLDQRLLGFDTGMFVNAV